MNVYFDPNPDLDGDEADEFPWVVVDSLGVVDRFNSEEAARAAAIDYEKANQ